MNSRRVMVGLLALLALVGAVWYAPVTLAQQPPLEVQGQVTNATQGARSVSGVTVVLHQESPTASQTQETTTDEEGRFSFEGVVFDPDSIYGVSVRFQGALYVQDIDLSSGSPPPLSLTVYDTSDDDGVLSASSASVLFAWADKSAQVVSALEIVKIVNGSDRTYVPGPEPMNLLRFGLPPGAQGLQVDTALAGADFVQVDRGFALLASVPPGEHEVLYAYEFPYSGTEVTFIKSLAYGAESLRVLAPEEVMGLSSGQLGNPEPVTIGGRLYQLLEATDLPRGARIPLRLDGLPEPSLGERIGQGFDDIRFEYAAPVGLGLFMAMLIAYALWRRATERRRRDGRRLLCRGRAPDSEVGDGRPRTGLPVRRRHRGGVLAQARGPEGEAGLYDRGVA